MNTTENLTRIEILKDKVWNLRKKIDLLTEGRWGNVSESLEELETKLVKIEAKITKLNEEVDEEIEAEKEVSN